MDSVGQPPLALRTLRLSVLPMLRLQTIEAIAPSRIRGAFQHPARINSVLVAGSLNDLRQRPAPCYSLAELAKELVRRKKMKCEKLYCMA